MISSKVTEIGDPVLCDVSRSPIPYGSWIVGTFQEYKDPGHFVGKGWMELVFDRIVIPPNGVVPISAKVVQGPGYHVDKDGRILGGGHAVRDTVEWFIPILWPLDILNAPRRGPRPVLKPETRLTLKVMEDIQIPLQSAVSSQVYYTPEPEPQPEPEPVSQLCYAQRPGAQEQPSPYRFAARPPALMQGYEGLAVAPRSYNNHPPLARREYKRRQTARATCEPQQPHRGFAYGGGRRR
jgi:hypothetical protein